MAMARTRLYFFNQIAARPDATIRIPEIYHARFDRGYERYIVMEYIDVQGFASDEQRVRAITDASSRCDAWSDRWWLDWTPVF